jgi:hypothetical protein
MKDFTLPHCHIKTANIQAQGQRGVNVIMESGRMMLQDRGRHGVNGIVGSLCTMVLWAQG